MNQYSFIVKYLLVANIIVIAYTQESTLKTLSVVFRHGDRTPRAYYRKNPNLRYWIYLPPNGELNNQGKRRQYELGYLLRQRYDHFLGYHYRSEDVFAISTDIGRARMSLHLVLASLYPPRKDKIWNEELNWQPVSSYVYVPLSIDTILNSLRVCPAYLREYARVQNLPDYRIKLSKYNDLMRDLTLLTGDPMTNSEQVYDLYVDLISETSSDLELPDWFARYFPRMLNQTMLEYELQNYNNLLKRWNGGSTIHKILDTIQSQHSKKLNLYSCHENNLVGILYALNVWDNAIPEFSSAILFEHHEQNSEKFIKVIYYRGIPPIFQELTLPGCETLCPLKDFLDITKEIVPNDPIEECYGPVLNSSLVPEGENPVKLIYTQIRDWYEYSRKYNYEFV